jgi:hypothetical protein
VRPSPCWYGMTDYWEAKGGGYHTLRNLLGWRHSRAECRRTPVRQPTKSTTNHATAESLLCRSWKRRSPLIFYQPDELGYERYPGFGIGGDALRGLTPMWPSTGDGTCTTATKEQRQPPDLSLHHRQQLVMRTIQRVRLTSGTWITRCVVGGKLRAARGHSPRHRHQPARISMTCPLRMAID